MRSRLFLLVVLLGFAPARAQGPDWVFHQGPFAGGGVMAVHPSGALFSQLDDHVLISWDDGRTWTVQSEEPFAPHRLEALTDGSLLAITSTQVWRSFDLGRSWDDTGLQAEELLHLAIDPNGPWYVAEPRGAIYRSADEGETWNELPPDGNVYIRAMIVSQGGDLIVTRGGGGGDLASMHRSTDGGQSWSEVDSGWGTRGVPLTRSYDGTLLLPSYRINESPPYGFDGLRLSEDDGATWSTAFSSSATGAFESPTRGRIIAQPGELFWAGPNLHASAVGYFFETPNGTLLANTTGYSTWGIDPPFFGSSGSGAYALRPNADTWTQIGPIPATVNDLYLGEDGTLLVGTDQAVIQSGVSGWEATGLNAGVREFLTLPGGQVLLAMEYPWELRLMEGLDEYGNWECSHDCGVSALAMSGGTLIVAADYALYGGPDVVGIHRTGDEGATWAHTLGEIGNVQVLEAAGGGVFYAGTNGYSEVGKPGVGVYRSNDDGLTWAPFIDGLTNTEVHALHADGPASVFAGTEDGVFHSEDGSAWTSIGLQSFTVYAFARTADGLIAGTDRGAFRYDGTAWEVWGEALSERAVHVLLPVDTEAGAFLVVGTDRGVYVDRPGLLTTPVETPEVPFQTAVRAYPNPAHTTLTVGLELPQSTDVQARLFDVLGRRIGLVWDGPLPAGRHALDAPVAHLPSGTYLLVVETDARRETRTITVVR